MEAIMVGTHLGPWVVSRGLMSLMRGWDLSHANSSTATSGLSALTPGSKSGMSSARKMHFQPIFERKRLSDIVLVWRRITGIIENWTSSYFGTFASISLELIMNPRFFNSLV